MCFSWLFLAMLFVKQCQASSQTEERDEQLVQKALRGQIFIKIRDISFTSASATWMCVEPLWDLYGFTTRHSQHPLSSSSTHHPTINPQGFYLGNPNPHSPLQHLHWPGCWHHTWQSSLQFCSTDEPQEGRRLCLQHSWGWQGLHCHSTPAHSLSSAPCKPFQPVLSSSRQREQGVTVTAGWGCRGATAQPPLVCPKDWHRLQLCWLPSG